MAGVAYLLPVAALVAMFVSKQSKPAVTHLETRSDYVDAAVCASCHAEIAATYARTGMGRSFRKVSTYNGTEDYTRANLVENKASGMSYTMLERDGRPFQRRHQTAPDGSEINVREESVDYVIGSGNHARSYLHRDTQGRLIELPVSWYTELGGGWAMSPGYDRKDQEDMRRAITPECMFCHNGYPRKDPEGVNGAAAVDAARDPAVFTADLPEGIDCQRCHGPGRAHVAAATAEHPTLAAIQAAIVNPRKLGRDRQMEVCMQCHLETSSRHAPNEIRAYDRDIFSYRPGDPLGDFKMYFEQISGKQEDTFEIAHAAYRLRKSACFRGSQMTCLTCHNPHDIPRGEVALRDYVAQCQSCHQAVKHTVALPAKENCISCHMPKRRTEDAVHVVMTDHYIQRDRPLRDLLAGIPEKEESPVKGSRTELYYPTASTLEVAKPWTRVAVAAAQVENGHGLEGVAHLARVLAELQPKEPQPYVTLAQAYSKRNRQEDATHWFQEALRVQPNYSPALQGAVLAMFATNNGDQATALLEKATVAAPKNDLLLTNLGNAYLRQGKLTEAQVALDKAVQIDPERADTHNLQGLLALQRGDMVGAEHAFREAIRLQPDLAEAQNNLGTLLTGAKRFSEAKAHFEQALAANPDYAEAHHGLGLLLILEGSLPGASVQLREAVRLQSMSAQNHTDLADALAAMGQVGAAADEYREVLRLHPGQADAELGLGIALLRQNRPGEARSLLESAATASDAAVSEPARDALGHMPR